MTRTTSFAILASGLLTAVALAGCAGTDSSETPAGDALSGQFTITGSSTAYPVGQAWAEEFQAMHRDVRVDYNVLGTGGGFQAFCRGEAGITGASRPIKESEVAACAANAITPFEVQVAIDGLAVVVSTQNTFAQDITVDELNRIWTADTTKQVNRWSELRPEWPDEPIALYGPGTNSGTFDYFVEVIIHPKDGTETKGRSDYTPSEDDNILVQGIASSPYALGYFGLAYVHENADKVRAVPVDNGAGPVAPTNENVEGGRYAPLARPIFYYTAGEPTGLVQEFLKYGLSDDGQALVEEVGYIPLPADQLAQVRAKVE
jgi:phosphate transport system substrate-binding protein